jgi:hypothetical protein
MKQKSRIARAGLRLAMGALVGCSVLASTSLLQPASAAIRQHPRDNTVQYHAHFPARAYLDGPKSAAE